MSTVPTSDHERPQRADAVRNRARVLSAATTCFAASGLDAQVDDVARLAGVGVGTVYRHFPTKDALLRALAEDHFERMEDLLREALDVQDAWEAFSGFVWRAVKTMAADRGLAQVLSERPEEMSEVALANDGLQEAVQELVARGKAAGALRADLDWRDLPMTMCVLGHAVQVQAPFMDLDRCVTLILDGLRAEGSTPLPERA